MGTTENEYLEMSKHFKEILDKKDNEIEEYKKDIKELKKSLMLSYSYAKILDDFITEEYPPYVRMLTEINRGYLSCSLDKYIFKEEEVFCVVDLSEDN